MSGGAEEPRGGTRAWGTLAGILFVVFLLVCAVLYVGQCAVRRIVDPASIGGGKRETVVVLIVDGLRAEDVLDPRALADAPALAAVLARSTVYERAYSSSVRANSAFASLLTGQHPTRHGVGPLAAPGQHALPVECETLAERFRAAGFRTLGAVSKPAFYAGFSGFGAGFDAYLDVPTGAAGPRTPAGSLGVLLGRLGAPEAQDEDWFLLLEAGDLQDPTPPPELALPLVGRELAPHSAELPDGPWTGDAREVLAEYDRLLARRRGSPAGEAYRRGLYLAGLAELDGEVERLVARLVEAGRWDRTTFVLCGLRGPRDGAVEESVRVPLAIRAPGQREGARSSALAQTVDVLPTLASMYGFAADAETDGLALVEAGAGPRRLAYAADTASSTSPAAFCELGVLRALPVLDQPAPRSIEDPRLAHPLRWEPADDAAPGAESEEVARLARRFLDEFLRPEEVELRRGAEAPAVRVTASLPGGAAFCAADLAGEPRLTRRPSDAPVTLTMDGAARTATWRLDRRNAAFRLSLEGEGLDEDAVFVGARPLSEVALPRVLLDAREPWPADAPEPRIDVRRGDDEAVIVEVRGVEGERVEGVLGWYPPAEVEGIRRLSRGCETELVADGRFVRFSGRAPLVLRVRRPGDRDVQLACSVDGRQVARGDVRVFGRRSGPGLHLYLPPWLPGVTDELFAPVTEPVPPGGLRIVRRGTGMPHAAMRPRSVQELQFIRKLGPRE